MVRTRMRRTILRALIGVALIYVIVLQGLFSAVSGTTHAAAQMLGLDSLAVICSSLNGGAPASKRQSDPPDEPRDHRLDQSTCCVWGTGHGSQPLTVLTTFAYVSLSLTDEGQQFHWLCQGQTGERSRFDPAAPPRAPPVS